MTTKTQVRAVFLLAAACACVGCHAPTAAIRWTVSAPSPPARFLPCTIVVRHETHRFTVYLPPGYTPTQTWPVIVALHGSGECGVDGVKPAEAGLGEALRRFPERFPCVVVFPQTAHELRYWTDDQGVVLAELTQTVRQFHGDRRRLYLTGYSLGGSGTWFLAARNPDLFAAIVPICGRVAIQASRAHESEVHEWAVSRDPYAAVAGHIGRLPVWVFHGANDPIVPVTESRHIVKALRSDGGDVRLTVLPHTGHGVWVPAYADPALPQWLLSQRLPE